MEKEVATVRTDSVPSFLCVCTHVCVCRELSASFSQTLCSLSRKSSGSGAGGRRLDAGRFFYFELFHPVWFGAGLDNTVKNSGMASLVRKMLVQTKPWSGE